MTSALSTPLTGDSKTLEVNASHWPATRPTSIFPSLTNASIKLLLPTVPAMMAPAVFPPLLPTSQSLFPVTLKMTEAFPRPPLPPVRETVPFKPVTRPKSRATSSAARRTPGQSAASRSNRTEAEELASRKASAEPLKATVGCWPMACADRDSNTAETSKDERDSILAVRPKTSTPNPHGTASCN